MMKRRNILKAVGAGATVGLAGCTGGSETPTATRTEETPASTATQTEGPNSSAGDDDGTPTSTQTATPAVSDNIDIEWVSAYEEGAECTSNSDMLYEVQGVSQTGGAFYAFRIDYYYDIGDECLRTDFLPDESEYDADSKHLTLHIGPWETFEGECKTDSDCSDGTAKMRFTEDVKVSMKDVDSERVDVETFSIVLHYPDESTELALENAKMEEGATNA